MAVSLSQNQKLFASALSKSTGLNPGAVEAWMIAEEPPGASSGYQGTQDWLNVGITDSGPKGSGNSVWDDPVSAAQATANWMKGTWADPGFGNASSGIQGILKTVGQTPAEQLAAIAGSGWASSGYGGAAKLQSLLGTVNGTPLPGVTLGAAPTSSSTLGEIPTVKSSSGPTAAASPVTAPNIFDTLAGLETSRQAIASENSNNTLSPNVEQDWEALANLFRGTQTVQNAQTNASNRVSTVAPQPQPGSVNSVGNVNVQPGNLQGFHVLPGVNVTKGETAQISEALAALGRHLGVTIYAISGYRTPAHSVAVGGFADDPHTKAEAIDIGVNGATRASAAQLTNAQLASVGLWRPFDMDGKNPNEVNHIQLIGTK